MSNLILKDVKAYMGHLALHGYSNEIELNWSAEIKDHTVFGLGTRRNKAGLLVVDASMSGFNDFDEDTGIDAGLYGRIGAVSAPLSVAPVGNAENEVVFFTSKVNGVYTPIGGTVGDMAEYSLDCKGAGVALIRGLVGGLGAKTATGNGTGHQTGAVSAVQRIGAALHVVAASGTTPTLDVVIESSVDNTFASPTTRLTFAQLTGVGSEFKSLVGPITDTYWRAKWTIAGTTPSFTVFIALGIGPK
jgi:hypothetical protein